MENSLKNNFDGEISSTPSENEPPVDNIPVSSGEGAPIGNASISLEEEAPADNASISSGEEKPAGNASISSGEEKLTDNIPMTLEGVNADASDGKNYEDVDSSISDIMAGRKKKKKPLYLIALMVIFFPITLIWKGGALLASKIRVKITVKATLIFAVALTALLAAYIIFVVVSVEKQIDSGKSAHEFMLSLKITGAILLVVFAFVGAVIGNLIGRAMLGPVRKLSSEIAGIDGNNLDKRLDTVDRSAEFVELTEQINKMLDNIQSAFLRQNNFISDASHELKTPLAVINGYSDLLLRWGKDNPEILKEGIDSISREAKFMKKLTEQLLLLAKLGKFNMNIVRFDLGAQAREIAESYSVLNLKQHLSVSAERVIVNLDRNLITEAIRTLIDNAIKYTPAKGGKIKISVYAEGEFAYVSIKDNGEGIAPAEQDKIFDRFYRCDKTRGREKGSAGLGLSICKSIVEMSGGSIKVKSELKKGSEFIIELPRAV